MADSAEVDEAVFAVLDDPTLKALCPDGVYRNNAPQGKTRVVTVGQASHVDEYGLGDLDAFETFTYVITAVLKDNSSVTANSAAQRIKELIEGLSTVTGYTVTVAQRTERIAYREPDPTNPDAFWQHIGGLYDVMVTPA